MIVMNFEKIPRAKARKMTAIFVKIPLFS